MAVVPSLTPWNELSLTERAGVLAEELLLNERRIDRMTRTSIIVKVLAVSSMFGFAALAMAAGPAVVLPGLWFTHMLRGYDAHYLWQKQLFKARRNWLAENRMENGEALFLATTDEFKRVAPDIELLKKTGPLATFYTTVMFVELLLIVLVSVGRNAT